MKSDSLALIYDIEEGRWSARTLYVFFPQNRSETFHPLLISQKLYIVAAGNVLASSARGHAGMENFFYWCKLTLLMPSYNRAYGRIDEK